MATATYTHVGSRAYIGHYAVTADAYRKPGRVHAMNAPTGTSAMFIGLCGTRVAVRSGDHFMQDGPQVVPAVPGHRITCKRCKAILQGEG